MGYRTYTCPIARTCGGCEWLAVPYPIQLRRKQAFVEELLGQVAKKDDTNLDEIRGMDEPVRYRYKAATPFAPGPRGQLRSGFYAARTHKIVACDTCLVEDSRARRILNAVAHAARELHIPAYQEDSDRGVLRHAIVRCGWKTNDILLVLVTRTETLRKSQELVMKLRHTCPELTSIVQNVNDRRTNAMLGHTNKTLFGSGVMHDQLLGCTFEIGPTSFYQTNPAQTETLYQLVLESLPHMRKQQISVLDAYCGTGTIGICAAAADKNIHVTGVEQVGNAISCARRNAQANGVDARCEFVHDDVTPWMTRSPQEKNFDVVILDPPRAGATPAFLNGMANLAPQNVIYVSCNVQTQARDLKLLRKHGYQLTHVAPVDMFPHTKHVECVAVLTRT